MGTIDVIGVAVNEQRAAVQVFPLREGRMVDRYSFHLENAAGEDAGEVLEQFWLEYYGAAPSLPISTTSIRPFNKAKRRSSPSSR